MRAGFTDTLIEGMRRAVPGVRTIIEACALAHDDYRQTPSDWNAADSVAGFQVLNDGRVRLTPSSTGLSTSVTSDGFQTSLDSRTGDFYGARITFSGNDEPKLELHSIVAYLNPVIDAVPANKEVAFWELHLYVKHHWLPPADEALWGYFQLIEIADPVRVTAAGTTAGNVTFSYADRSTRPRPIFEAGDVGHVYVEIRAIKADGATAGNAGWGKDSTVMSVVSGGKTLTGTRLTVATEDFGGPGLWSETDTLQTARITLNLSSIAAATLAFTDETGPVQNVLDLGATPTGTVEFRIWGEAPGGSTLQLQIRNNADSAWINCADGQTSDDIGVSKRQTYKFQIIFTVNGAGTVGPTLVMVGVAEIATQNFDQQAAITGGRVRVDPVTMKGEISEAVITFIKDGITDYHDAISDLLTTYTIKQIEFREWIGHPDLARRYWGLKDVWRIDDTANDGPSVSCTVISPLAELRQKIPILDTMDTPPSTTPLVYSGEPKDVIADIVDVQMALPARYRGPLFERLNVGNVTKTISDSDAKAELDYLGLVLGYGFIPSQGRIKGVPMLPDVTDASEGGAIRATVPWHEARFGTVSPGIKDRVVEYFVNYGFDFSKDPPQDTAPFNFTARSFHNQAIAALGRARLGEDPHPEEEVEKWLPAEAILSLIRVGTTVTAICAADHHLATGAVVLLTCEDVLAYNGEQIITVTASDTFTFQITGTPANGSGVMAFTAFAHKLATRTTDSMGPGLMLLPFETTYQYHELEPGDLMAVQTDRIVVKDPTTGLAIRGMRWVVVCICDTVDRSGRRFIGWVRSYGSILSSSEAAEILGFGKPEVMSVQLYGDEGGEGVITADVNTKDAASVRWAASTVGYPDRATTAAGTLVGLNPDGHAFLGTLDTIADGDTLYVSVLAYEDAAGVAFAAPMMSQKQTTRHVAVTKVVTFAHSLFVDSDPTVPSHRENAYTGMEEDEGAGDLVCALAIPEGVLLTEMAIEGTANGNIPAGPNSGVGYDLYRLTAGGGATLLATGNLTNSGTWIVDTNVLSETVDPDDRYLARVLPLAGTTTGSYARFSMFQLTYTVPSYFETY